MNHSAEGIRGVGCYQAALDVLKQGNRLNPVETTEEELQCGRVVGGRKIK